MTGTYTEQNFKKALFWYKKASEKGDADAQFYVGYLLLNGLGTQKDTLLAKKFLNMAAKQKHSKAIEQIKFLN